jgi:hypothetical protein
LQNFKPKIINFNSSIMIIFSISFNICQNIFNSFKIFILELYCSFNDCINLFYIIFTLSKSGCDCCLYL